MINAKQQRELWLVLVWILACFLPFVGETSASGPSQRTRVVLFRSASTERQPVRDPVSLEAADPFRIAE